MPKTANTQRLEAKETYLNLIELSKLLNTGLDSETLMICVRLCEAGVNPETLANVIQDLEKMASSNKDQVNQNARQ